LACRHGTELWVFFFHFISDPIRENTSLSAVKFEQKKLNDGSHSGVEIFFIFVQDFPHFVSASDIYFFICVREQSVCHMVSTWHVDWVPLARERTLGTSVFVQQSLV